MGARTEIRLQPRDLDLFRELFESRLMTLAHAAALHFEGSGEAAKKRLQKLKAAGYLGERARHVTEAPALFLTRKAMLLLEEQGVMNDYPHLGSFSLAKRSSVSDFTLRHELEVMDVKAAFFGALRSSRQFKVDQFTTWPLLCRFEACESSYGGKEIPVEPDGFLRITEWDNDRLVADQSFFFALDRSEESLDRLVSKANRYLSYYRSGGFAVRCGGERNAFDKFPFRVLIVVKTPERRNNIAERLLQNRPPILRQVYLSTFAEAVANPVGNIWIRPIDYQEATADTPHEPKEGIRKWGYRRQTARELLVEERIKKCPLIDD
jgi:hypothetical protein